MRMILLAVSLLAVVACVDHAIAGPVVELQCFNEITPKRFRIVYGDTARPDTTPIYENRYAIPHRSADTFNLIGNGGEKIRWVLGYVPFDGNHCRTYANSLATYIGTYRKLIKLP